MKKTIVNWTIIMLMFGLAAACVLAAYQQEPTPPTEELTVVSSARRPLSGVKSIKAEAGNVSELRINSSSVTQGWQGYFGNITGTIVLDDASNNSMYTWDLADPEGEIFSSRTSSINWTNGAIICADITHIQTEETALNFNSVGQDVDGINETFSYTSHPAFVVGNNSFTTDECNFTVTTYVSDAAPASTGRTFNETLLYDNTTTNNATVYMAYIYQGATTGFNGVSYDFQMLVPEDGHDSDTTPTDYYFWVEIE